MKITVGELPDETARRETAWADLVCSLRANPTDVVVLQEMPFCEWQTFRTRKVDLAAWRAALAAHDTMMTRLGGRPARSASTRYPASRHPARARR